MSTLSVFAHMYIGEHLFFPSRSLAGKIVTACRKQI